MRPIALTRLSVAVVAALVASVSETIPVAAATVMQESPLVGIPGRYVLPEKTPTQLVVFAHGHDNSSVAWVGHMKDAANHGAVAVTPDYRGLDGPPGYGGWPAVAGAEDLVTSARFFLARCPSIKQVFLAGVSMGGNMSGLALASKPTRPDGSTPLFDYWVDVEGVNDLIQEYWIARGAGLAGVASGTVAQAEIEKETGGPIESKPAEYVSRTNYLRAADIAASGVRGAVLVHGIEDGLVPSPQSDLMFSTLLANQVPTDYYSVVRRGQERDPGHDQTSGLSDTGDPTLSESDPFAGHGWEGSNTHIVINT
ncbi:MAG: hypothetical protein M3O87_06895, partial [Candidatus Dormibacteraeota bacterium]|nr:hypothetical protein [Candidatus Dormibacteraeota bacterium]